MCRSRNSLWRQLYRKDDAVTGRINLDWTPNDKDLIYFSVTSGTRAGGFNLGLFSANAKYQPESLVAYELGYKGEIFDGTMQVNSAVYYYDYSHVHTPAASPSATRRRLDQRVRGAGCRDDRLRYRRIVADDGPHHVGRNRQLHA